VQHNDIIAAIRIEHRERNFAMEQRKRLRLSLLAFLRLVLGWRKDLPEKERNDIAKRAMAIAAGEDDPETERWKDVVAASDAASGAFDKIEADATKRMETMAKQLPAWGAFGESVRGFGARSLAVIVGEAGDLSEYATHSKLWKRMGLAVIDGKRQGGLGKATSADTWIAHGYSKKRRSHMWNIGQSLVQGNRDGKYRTIFLSRLGVEHAKAIERGLVPATIMKATVASWEGRGLPPLTLVKKINPDEHMSAGHMDKRAQRYMEKALLRHLWKAWRRASLALPERAMTEAPAVASPIPARAGAAGQRRRAQEGHTSRARRTKPRKAA
jgi:hypothetical protein